MGNRSSVPAPRVIPAIGNGDNNDDDSKSDGDAEYEPQPMPCNHPNWSHSNDDQDFDSACSFLCLIMDPDEAQHYVEKLQKKSLNGKIEHYKPKDILRAAKLPLLPPDNPDVAQHIAMIKKGQKMSPPLILRGDDGHHAIIAAGYHRACAGYYDDMNGPIPCVVKKQ